MLFPIKPKPREILRIEKQIRRKERERFKTESKKDYNEAARISMELIGLKFKLNKLKDDKHVQ